jgi:branched-chain amino acid transport system substrate-binding protein
MKRSTVLLAGLLVAGLATGCGSSGTADSQDSSADGEIVLGVSLPLSGATPLPQFKDGYQAAVDDVNAAGGLTVGGKKRRVKLVVLDNRSDVPTMTTQVRTLVLEDKAVGLLGACCQYNINLASLADGLQTPAVMSALPLELMPPTKGYAFLAFQTLEDAAVQFYGLASGTATNKKIVFVVNNDAAGLATQKQWAAAGQAAGFDVVADAAVPAGTTDFADVIGKAKGAGAEILIAAMTPPECFAMWKQMKALAYAPKVAIGLQCAQTPGWQQLGALGDGALAVMNWSPTSGLPQASMIDSRFSSKYPNLADLSAVPIGYADATILMKAVEAAGSTDRKKVTAALKTLKVSTTLGDVAFENGKSKTPTYIGQWKGGNLKQVFPVEGAGAELELPVPGLSR